MEDYNTNEVTASVFKNYRTSLERIEKFISPIYFTDVNLFGQLYPKKESIKEVYHVALSNISSKKLCKSQRPSFAEAIKLDFKEKVSVGSSFGPTWASHWFKLTVVIPADWLGKEVHLRWNSESEALIWSSNGHPLQGLNNQHRNHFIISQNIKELEYTYYVEMACNTLFGAGNGLINPPDNTKNFTLQMLEIAIFDREIYDLLIDLETLHDIAKELKDTVRGYQALYTANQIINSVDFTKRSTIAHGHKLATNFFSQKNGESQLSIIAIGNCHIDSAWLWPYGETIRKCARSWSSTIRLLEREDLKMIFACSQAQQLFWVKSEYPTLFEEMQQYIKNGKFIPIGGTWVEMDGNIPSGESFIRQFLYGQKFLKDEFNITSRIFWLPDTFGYSAQLPQIIKLCGAKYFISQKLSWNLVNKFPHHSFVWEGIDGSKVLTHFPPANTYSSSVTVEEVLNTSSNLNDKGRVSSCMLLFGHGDGGGGPDENMCQRLKRLKNSDGCPKLEIASPDVFCSQLEQAEKNLNHWTGELYLELHNGTYTTQALMKLYNRKCEFLLQQLEFFTTILAMKLGLKDNFQDLKNEIELLWKNVLLNQFHDVLPGSSIKIVHEEAVEIYKETVSKIENLQISILKTLFGTYNEDLPSKTVILCNTLPWERMEALQRDILEIVGAKANNEDYAIIKIPPMSCLVLKSSDIIQTSNTWVKTSQGLFEIRNKYVKAVVDNLGRIKSLYHFGSGKEAISENNFGNQFIVYDDIPLFWDAWDVMDYHIETGKLIIEPQSEAALENDKNCLSIKLKVSEKSTIKIEITLPPHKPYLIFKINVDWNENHKFLKVQFPLNVHSQKATYDIQFGHIERPTHFNTSWDWAKYEVCGHKWVDISENDWGVALLNDCKYGHAVHKNIMRLSLLRSSKAPDESADIGLHEFKYAIFPHSGSFQQAEVIKEAYIFNSSVVTHKTSLEQIGQFPCAPFELFFKVDHPGIVIETVKLATHVDNAVVVRMYESFGGRCSTVFNSVFPYKTSSFCNGLEDEITSSNNWSSNGLPISFTPFQIKSLLLKW